MSLDSNLALPPPSNFDSGPEELLEYRFDDIRKQLLELQEVYWAIEKIPEGVKVSSKGNQFKNSTPEFFTKAAEALSKIDDVLNRFRWGQQARSIAMGIAPAGLSDLAKAFSIESVARSFKKDSVEALALTIDNLRKQTLQVLEICAQEPERQKQKLKAGEQPNIGNIEFLIKLISEINDEFEREGDKPSKVEKGFNTLINTYAMEEDLSKSKAIQLAINGFKEEVPTAFKLTLKKLKQSIMPNVLPNKTPLPIIRSSSAPTMLPQSNPSAERSDSPSSAIFEGAALDVEHEHLAYVLNSLDIIEILMARITQIKPGEKVAYFDGQMQPRVPDFFTNVLETAKETVKDWKIISNILGFIKTGVTAGISRVSRESGDKTAYGILETKHKFLSIIKFCTKSIQEGRLSNSEMDVINDKLEGLKREVMPDKSGNPSPVMIGFNNLVETYKDDPARAQNIREQADTLIEEVGHALRNLKETMQLKFRPDAGDSKEHKDDRKRDENVTPTTETPSPSSSPAPDGLPPAEDDSAPKSKAE